MQIFQYNTFRHNTQQNVNYEQYNIQTKLSAYLQSYCVETSFRKKQFSKVLLDLESVVDVGTTVIGICCCGNPA